MIFPTAKNVSIIRIKMRCLHKGFFLVVLSLVSLGLLGTNAFSKSNDVKEVQKLLNVLGYEAGVADGISGRNTLRAIESFYEDIGGNFSGKISKEDISSLNLVLSGGTRINWSQKGGSLKIPTIVNASEGYLNNMGDLNDDPVNKSVKDYIRAKAKVKKMKDGDMYNTMYDKYKQGDCTLAYRDAWNLFDQLIISEGLTGNDCSSFVFHKSYVYNKPYLRQKEGLYKGYPKRTHAGGKYLNGYSDHFPVYLVLKKEVK